MSNPTDSNPRKTPLTLAECFTWCDRYRSTPWNMLAFSTASDKQPSPMLVLGSLEYHARQLTKAEKP